MGFMFNHNSEVLVRKHKELWGQTVEFSLCPKYREEWKHRGSSSGWGYIVWKELCDHSPLAFSLLRSKVKAPPILCSSHCLWSYFCAMPGVSRLLWLYCWTLTCRNFFHSWLILDRLTMMADRALQHSDKLMLIAVSMWQRCSFNQR